MDPEKLKGISDWPTPKSIKEIRSFLGLCNYYRRFIEDYANRARALNNRLRKDLPFEWPDKCQLSFDDLKGCFAHFSRPLNSISRIGLIPAFKPILEIPIYIVIDIYALYLDYFFSYIVISEAISFFKYIF